MERIRFRVLQASATPLLQAASAKASIRFEVQSPAEPRVHYGLSALLPQKDRVLDFAFLNKFLHRSRYVFDRHVQIDTMLVEQIDGWRSRQML
jgi:hypothetical protein